MPCQTKAKQRHEGKNVFNDMRVKSVNMATKNEYPEKKPGSNLLTIAAIPICMLHWKLTFQHE
jgi:hypothetical protein